MAREVLLRLLRLYFSLDGLPILVLFDWLISFKLLNVLEYIEGQALVFAQGLIDKKLVLFVCKVKPNDLFRVEVEVSGIVAVLFDGFSWLDQLSHVDRGRICGRSE